MTIRIEAAGHHAIASIPHRCWDQLIPLSDGEAKDLQLGAIPVSVKKFLDQLNRKLSSLIYQGVLELVPEGYCHNCLVPFQQCEESS